MMQQLTGGHFGIQGIKYVYLLLKLKANSRHSRCMVRRNFWKLEMADVLNFRQSVNGCMAEEVVFLDSAHEIGLSAGLIES